MAVELAERLGPSLVWWLAQPLAFALWSYYHVQEYDHRTGWVDRIRRINSAHLSALAYHEPRKIDDERRLAIADAGPPPSTKELQKAEQMALEIDLGGVLDD